TEHAPADKAVSIGLERAVVDRLRLLDFAERPRPGLLRRGEGDPDLDEGWGVRDRVEDVQDFLVHLYSFCGLGRESRLGNWFAEWTAPPAPASGAHVRQPFSSSTFRPSERISLTSTLNDSGMPASKLSSPRTMAS